MLEKPEAELGQPRPPRLHAVGRAALDREAGAGERPAEPLRFVAAPVADQAVESRPAFGVERRREQQGRAVPGDASQLAQRQVLVVDVLDDVESANQLETSVGERQRRDPARDGVGPARRSFATAGALRSTKAVLSSGSRGRNPGPTSSRGCPGRISDATSGQVLNRSGSTSSASAHRGS